MIAEFHTGVFPRCVKDSMSIGHAPLPRFSEMGSGSSYIADYYYAVVLSTSVYSTRIIKTFSINTEKDVGIEC